VVLVRAANGKKKINIYRMKNIKRFEQFSYLQEGNEAGFLQRDPMVGAADFYKDMYADIKKQFGTSLSEIQPKLNDLVDKLIDKLNQSQIENAVKKAENYFGLPAEKITYSVIKNNLQRMNESKSVKDENEDYEPKNILESITRTLYEIFSFNFIILGMPLTIVAHIACFIKHGSEWEMDAMSLDMEKYKHIIKNQPEFFNKLFDGWFLEIFSNPLFSMYLSLLAAIVFLILTSLLRSLGRFGLGKFGSTGRNTYRPDNIVNILKKEFAMDSSETGNEANIFYEILNNKDKSIRIEYSKNKKKLLRIIVGHKWPGETEPRQSRSFEDFSEKGLNDIRNYLALEINKPKYKKGDYFQSVKKKDVFKIIKLKNDEYEFEIYDMNGVKEIEIQSLTFEDFEEMIDVKKEWKKIDYLEGYFFTKDYYAKKSQIEDETSTPAQKQAEVKKPGSLRMNNNRDDKGRLKKPDKIYDWVSYSNR
jgi:hypothetical protein